MELIKRDDRWDLYNEDGHKIASTLDGCVNKLSIKNCQAIENGYDLDELAMESSKSQYLFFDCACYETAFIRGFQKALEILGDKKFSEDDIIDCWETAHQAGRFEEKGIAETNWQTAINYTQSLQQTEWDVVVVMRPASLVYKSNLVIEELDADGCLILKRK